MLGTFPLPARRITIGLSEESPTSGVASVVKANLMKVTVTYTTVTWNESRAARAFIKLQVEQSLTRDFSLDVNVLNVSRTLTLIGVNVSPEKAAFHISPTSSPLISLGLLTSQACPLLVLPM